MRTQLLIAAAAVATAAATSAAAASRVEIKDAAARVTVIPENRPDVKVEFVTTNAALPMRVSTFGDRLIVDGNLRHRIRSCHGGLNLNWNFDANGRHSEGHISGVEIAGVGRVSFANLPQVVVRVPMNADVGASGAVYGSIGRAAQVHLSNAGCGDWTVANVSGPLNVDVAGSGDVHTGSSRDLKVQIAGSGDVATQAVGGGADVRVAGSGDIRVASISGPLRAEIAGSGDVRVQTGRAPSVVAHIAGSGDVEFRGSTQTVDATIAGSGDVRVDRVSGEVHKRVLGSGSVYVNGHELSRHDRDHDGDRDRDRDDRDDD